MPDIIAEKYEVMETIGRGGMGTVYKARQTNLDRIVAIKMLSEELASDPEFRARFQQEATVVARLNHPNIVQIHDIEAHGNTFCIIMEFVDGENLQAKIDRDVTLHESEIVTIGAQVSRALAYAHSRGVIHRDIKPDNIHVTPKGEAKVMDFGIARYTDSKLKTQTGISMGTPKFMSPEQVTGKNVDGQTDLYSLGVCLYYCLAGRPPFDGENAISVATRHLYEQPEPPSKLNSSISPAVEKVILHAMEKQKANRYATGYDMADALEATLNIKTPVRSDAEADERFGGDATLRMPVQQPYATPVPGITPEVPVAAPTTATPTSSAAPASLTPLRTHSVPELEPDFRTPRQELNSLDTAKGLKKSLILFGGMVITAAILLIILVIWLRKPDPDQDSAATTGSSSVIAPRDKYTVIMTEIDALLSAGKPDEARLKLIEFRSRNLDIKSEQLLLVDQRIRNIENLLPVAQADVLFERRGRMGKALLGDMDSLSARNALGYAYIKAARELYDTNPQLPVSTASLSLVNSYLGMLKFSEQKNAITQEKLSQAEASFGKAHQAAESNGGRFPLSSENDLIQAVELDFTNPNYWLALGTFYEQYQQIDDARVMYMEATSRTQDPQEKLTIDAKLQAISG